MNYQIKRIYDEKEASDGFRVLVDRLWPRGISKEKAAIDLWAKDIAPSSELRKWFNHDPEKWPEFRKRYQKELKDNSSAVDQFHAAIKGHKKITLLYGAKDTEHNQAIVLRDLLK